ncbi:helix-turn-helix domain-containing protein [Lewinella sp. LCG006]|uniref:helix-turn-helix domain-containing protein n=1 Tax=Lewinella sp. LCG006 TaxID=3231911 RepID=UPI00345F7528
MRTSNQLHLEEDNAPLLTDLKNSLLSTSLIEGQAIPYSRPVFFEEDQQWLTLIAQCVQENLANNKYTVKQLAFDVAISERQLRRRMKQLLGMGPGKYILQKRLHHAQQLISKRKYKTITRVAREVGYKDVDSFRSNFQSFFGVSPKECLGF